MTRPCSHCHSNGHSNRPCSGGGGGLRLFGVRVTDGSIIKKSASMGNLSRNSSAVDLLDGYHSDDLDHGFTDRRRPMRKKGVPWTEQEHMQFLLGLDKLGRGNWRAISRNYVPSRTPTQVASHAQKYFIRQSNSNEPGKKKRPSLFDLEPNMETNPSKPDQISIPSPEVGTDNGKMFSSSQAENMNDSLPSLDLSLKPAFTPFPFQLWPPNARPLEDYGAETSQNQINKSMSVVREEPMKEIVGMSRLTLEESGRVQIESLPFSIRVSGNQIVR